MNSDHLLLIGIRGRVKALSQLDGRILWSTDLPGGTGDSFVTLLVDAQLVFAYSRGSLHGLDLATGRLLWSNDLPGCGYGFACLASADGAVAPNPGTAAAAITDRQARSST